MKTVIEMAREAQMPFYWRTGEITYLDRLERFAELVRADEREACAKVADTISDKYGWGHYGNEVDTADEISAAIRARGQS